MSIPRFLSRILTPAIIFGCLASTFAAEKGAKAAAQPKQEYPSPAPADPAEKLGDRIQRTMRLLATSTPEHRNRVKILFYGQSITEQTWSKEVARDLRARFPHADLVIENRAIGGFSSQVLINPAEHDLYPFYPDLLIFQVYGANQQYEEIIANVRRRTTAEVLMQKDHLTAWPNPDAKPEGDKGLWWSEMMNGKFLPDIARRYGCALVDVRSAWTRYLKDNHLEPKDLLKDGVHLNDRGNYLLAELVKRYLRCDPALSPGVPDDAVKTYVVGKDLAWRDGRLVLEFEGNRIDAILDSPGPQAAPAAVTIDGRRPSEFPELYVFTRPSPTQAGFWPGIIRVASEKRPEVEKWTARITETNDDASLFRFEVTGSKTGPDGSGTSDKRFVSRSDRVVIEPEHWWLRRAQEFSKKKLNPGFEIRWEVLPLFHDTIAPAAAPGQGRENVQTIAQGLKNVKHRLELHADGPSPIRVIRVYRPPVK